MALGPEELDLLIPEPVPGVRIVPVVHGRLEVAAWVRAVLDTLDPAGVAVELPTTLDDAARLAVDRLPRITLVISADPSAPGGEIGGEQAVVWTVAPGDPFAEALRWAAERGRERFLVDPDIPYAERHNDPVPDPYALLELGPGGYLGPVLDSLAAAPASEEDRRREEGMAYHVLRARESLTAAAGSGAAGGPLVVLVGAAHVRRLADDLRRPVAAPFARVRPTERTRPEARHLHPESLTALLQDPPLAHAAWELLRSGDLPDRDPGTADSTESPGAADPADPADAVAARPVSLTRAGLTLVSRRAPGETGEGDRFRRLVELAAREGARRLPWRAPDLAVPDRKALSRVVWRVAARSYTHQTREEVAPWQRRVFFDYLRRLERTRGMLAGGLYEWVVAARGVADDNLAWELFEAARAYPWQSAAGEGADDLPIARVDGSDLLLPEDWGTRTVRFRRRHFRVKRRPVALPVRRRPTPADDDEWAEWLRGFSGGGLCSFPPEDLVIEDYGRFLRAKAQGILSAERTHTEPFSTSLLDGVDVRETLRHPEDPRIWVREQRRAPGRAGSVVVIFDRDRRDEGSAGPRYPYLMTWHGEHHDESDMAFYSTHPAEQVVGPGIMRATYGGFLMTVPPGRLFDVWRDPDYRHLPEKADRLLAAAIDYSMEPVVVHVAEDPPRPALGRYAAARGKRIVHIPIGSLSVRTLRKVRVLHILVGRDKREIAEEYVW